MFILSKRLDLLTFFKIPSYHGGEEAGSGNIKGETVTVVEIQTRCLRLEIVTFSARYYSVIIFGSSVPSSPSKENLKWPYSHRDRKGPVVCMPDLKSVFLLWKA